MLDLVEARFDDTEELPQTRPGEDALSQAGWLISLYALGVVVGAPTIAASVAKYPRHRVMLILAAALTAFNALTFVMPTFELVAVSRFLAGLPHGAYFGVAPWLVVLLRVAFVAMAVFSLWFLYRYYRTTNELLWLTTSSGVLLTTTFLVGALGQGYYSMALFPFVMTIVLPNSVLRNWPAWLAIYGFFSMDRWLLVHWPTTGRALEYLKITYGWCLLLIVVMMVLVLRYRDAKAAGTLDSGLDPDWMGAAIGTKESADDDDIERPEGESDRRTVAGATDS